MIWNAANHHAVIDPQVIVSAAGAAAFLYARFKVTPVADPKDGNGQPLAAVPLLPAIHYGGGGGGGEYSAQKTLIAPVAPESDQPGAAGPVT